jgi:tRNA pseudouridine65 synthase
MSLQVLYRDEGMVVVNKPAGMVVHRGWAREGPVLVDELRHLTGLKRVHPIHRLDRGTSGALVVALNAERARELGAVWENGLVTKCYLALVRGCPPDQGDIDHPLPRREGGPRVPAQSTFCRLCTAATEPRHVSLVKVWPRTGRLHQVRRHLKHISHPVIGDANYGKGPLNRALRERYGLARLALHALELSFPVPGPVPLRVRAPLPDDLIRPWRQMGLCWESEL